MFANDLSKRAPIALASLFALALLFIVGCEQNPSEAEDFDPLPTLYAFLENGAPVDTVHLEWTAAYNVRYNPVELGIEGAEIVVYPIFDENGTALDTTDADINDYVLHFRQTAGREFYGEYIPAETDYLHPRSLWTYRIEARKPADGIDMWAETTVPDTFSYFTSRESDPYTPVEIDGDTLTREADEVFINWTESLTARGFVLGIIAETEPDQLIPLDPEWDPNNPDDALEPSDLDRHNWTIARYDQRAMTIGWIFFEWSGWNRLYISAASESYYEYMLSIMQSEDPSWKNNPTYNMHGGIGIFGATYTHEFNIFLERVEP